jgi:nitric oxide reductase NorD protein
VEAEDVVLEGAERAAHAARALWRRGLAAEGLAPARAAEARRRLDLWQQASFGRSWPVAAQDAAPAPRWLARVLGRLPPWQLAPVACAATDGARLFLPRSWLEGEPSPERADVLLCAALGLGARLAGGRTTPPAEADAAARDVYACIEGALADAWLVRRFPGLAAPLEGVRRCALAARPALERLRPAERRLEELVRALLSAPPSARVAEAAGLEAQASVTAAAAFARRFAEGLGAEARAAGYRGVAPVPHWGILLAPGAARPAARGGEAEPGVPERRSRRLPRRPRRRALEPEESGRTGPFLPPPLADPQLSVQDPAGLERPPDRGDEDPGALAEALAELEELAVVGSDEPVREVLAEDEDDGGAAASGAAEGAGAGGAGAFAYPEWDFRARGYRLAACRLREAPAAVGDPGWAARVRSERAALLRPLRRGFEALRPRRLRVARQLAGDDLDIASWVDEWADRRAGLAPEGRIYAQDRPRRRDVAVALLVDASGSTDAWVSGGARVIDVAKEAALCFCEALAALGDRHAVYAFSGRGAGNVRVWVAKRFAEPAGAPVDARLAGLAPDASTRLGAALRHVTGRLAEEPARVRLLLLLSDGKPNDDDEYGGPYGVEDARQAVAEARATGVQVFCATIDRSGPAYLPRLFGPAGFTVLRDVEELPWRLPDLYRRLTST